LKVKQLISELKKCDPNLPVDMFAHDHNDTNSDEGAGSVNCVYESEDENGRRFVVLRP